jgi:hypothetical protein
MIFSTILTGGHMSERANPIDVEQTIKARLFPASKTDLIQFAEEKKASSQIISALRSIPDRQYASASDAARETYFEDSDLPRGMDSCDD